MDSNFSKYWSTANVHDSGVEISQHFSISILEAVREFKKVNGIEPIRIIIFRDGVANSQVDAVISQEIPAIKNIFAKVTEGLTPGYIPKILCVNVNKRIDQKFYVGDNLNRVENAISGTLVESDVTNGTQDFFLISQRTTQGTATPTHYSIIYNDLKDM